MLSRIWRRVAPQLIALFVGAAWGSTTPALAQSTDQAAMTQCRQQFAADAAGYNRCVDESMARVRARRGACLQEMQRWAARTEDLRVMMEQCMAAESIDRFRSEQLAKMPQDKATSRVPVDLAPAQARRWEGFDGRLDMDVERLQSPMWEGAHQGGVPVGEGLITTEVIYRHHGILRTETRRGELAIRASMREGQLHGPVEILRHPLFKSSAEAGAINQFQAGVNGGIALSNQCAAQLDSPAAQASVDWYGTCKGSQPWRGIAVYKLAGRAFDVACYAGGSRNDRSEIRGFEPCEDYWKHVPDTCKSGAFRGVCRPGQSEGAGVMVETKSELPFNDTGKGLGGALAQMSQAMSPNRVMSYKIERGQFQGGELHGYGYRGVLTQCGPAGCSGTRSQEVGWFRAGKLSVACESYEACQRRVSGADFTNAPVVVAPARIASLRNANDFASALELFEATREAEDLRRVRALAVNDAQKAQFQLALLRVAGFDKAFTLKAHLQAGGKSLALSESEHILGFVRGTSADVPLRLQWELSNREDVASIRHGTFVVRMTLGVTTKTKRKSCFGNLCRDDEVQDTFTRPITAVLHAGKLVERGSFDLRTAASSANAMFGMGLTTDMVDAVPLLRIEQVELQ